MGERRTYRSALPLSLGVALIGVGLIAFNVGPGADVAPLLLGAGLGAVVVGVYQLVDNIDRAARAIVEGRR